MTTPAKLFGKNLGEYDEVDVDELLAQLSAEEIKILAKEVDPDVSIAVVGILLQKRKLNMRIFSIYAMNIFTISCHTG